MHNNSDMLNEYRRPPGYAAMADAIPFVANDTLHLFNLASPANTTVYPPRLRSTWVRQTTTDLVHWKRHKPVIVPGNLESDPDCSGAWTGSVTQGPDGNMHIFYTGLSIPRGGEQVILHAKSPDPWGTSFMKSSKPIQLDEDSDATLYESTDFRDPYVFYNDDEGRYWMVVATRGSSGPYWTRGCIALLTSTDLETWTLNPKPLYYPNNIFCPECPELFTLRGKWYLVYSRFSSPDAGTLYVMADNPYGPFRSPRDGSGGRLDGRRWYAAKSCPKIGDPTRRISFGWVHDRAEGQWLWGGELVAPRDLQARNDGSLEIQPTRAFLELFRVVASPPDATLVSVGTTSAASLEVDCFATLSIVFTVGSPDAKAFGLLLNYDHNMRGHRLEFRPVTAAIFSITLVTDVPPFDDFWAALTSHKEIPKLVDGPELVRHGAIRVDAPVRLILSGDVIELFVDGKAVTYRLPQREKPPANGSHGTDETSVHRVGFFVEDGEVSFSKVQVLEL